MPRQVCWLFPRHVARTLFVASLTLVLPATTMAGPSDPLAAGFHALPNAARPRVWWNWIDGNVTRTGIVRDLQWLAKTGIGGVDIIDVSLKTPRLVKHPLEYMSVGWKSAFLYATHIAKTLGLEISIDSSPGWGLTGGPWVRPENAMKKLVWSTVTIEGGTTIDLRLPEIPSVTGPYQNVPYTPTPGPFEPAHAAPLPSFSAPVAVVAYREKEPDTAAPVITLSSGGAGAALLQAGDLIHPIILPAHNGTAWIDIKYIGPVTIRSMILGTSWPSSGIIPTERFSGLLQALDPSGHWQDVKTATLTTSPQVTVSFAPVKASEFRVQLSRSAAARIQFKSPIGADVDFLNNMLPPLPDTFLVSELRLLQSAQVNEVERKAGFSVASNYYALDTPPEAESDAISPRDVVDISPNVTADGRLQWQAPPGRWRILRFGYSLTGTINHPAVASATGLEADKLSSGAVESYLESYLGEYSRILHRHRLADSINALTVDSAETGPQNWTDDMLKEFARLRGYNPRPWLPVFSGVIVGSASDSDKFLWDFRTTIAELLAANHFDTLAKVAHAHDLTLYGEALENGRPMLGDDMAMRRSTDIPMGAMWTFGPDNGPMPGHVADDRGAASVAHIYGKNLVAAESFTDRLQPWAFSPADLKPIADREFALGINRIVIHASPHQPGVQPPGLRFFVYGQDFTRFETWASSAGAWINYLARSSYLLEQGRFVADVAYFYGQEGPLTQLAGDHRLDDVPQHYGFDYINADILLHSLKAEGGLLIAPSGVRYRALQLGGASARLTVPVLKKLEEFASNGVLIIGEPPVASPSLADNVGEFERLRTQLWSGTSGIGHAVTGPIDDVLGAAGVSPDVVPVAAEKPHLLFVHRVTSTADIYFLNNAEQRALSGEASFRITGKVPEVWQAETGSRRAVAYRTENGRTLVSIKMEPQGSVFVVFREPGSKPAVPEKSAGSELVATLNGPWRVSFQTGPGAPRAVTEMTLSDWSKSTNKQIKYFSGTAIYRKSLSVQKNWLATGQSVLLDLGEVHEIAAVSVNGKVHPVLWHEPYKLDISNDVHPGRNAIEINVTNLWVNRLVGDQQPGAKKLAPTNVPTYLSSAPLRPSGLIGPVRVETGGPRGTWDN